jgi:Family of unknown function (DUF6232)
MALNEFLPGDNSTKIAEATLLEVTKKIVRFGDDVYQFRNVTGFGIGEVRRGRISFIGWIIVLVISIPLWGIPLILAILYSLFLAKSYGLMLYLNSGEAQIFITSDRNWLKKAVGTLYDFMQNAEEGSHMTLQVGGNIAGNIIQNGKIRDVSTHVVKNILKDEND